MDAKLVKLGLLGTSIKNFSIYPNSVIFGESAKIGGQLWEHIPVWPDNIIPNASIEIYVDGFFFDATTTDDEGKIVYTMLAVDVGVGTHIIQLKFPGDWIHYSAVWSTKGELRVGSQDYPPSPPQPPGPFNWKDALKYGLIGVGAISGGYLIYRGISKRPRI